MHHVSAVIGEATLLEELRVGLPGARIVELPQGFALVPATREVIAAAGEGEKVHGFYHATTTLVRALERASERGPLVYVETEYFGGAGGQAALVLRGGRCESVSSSIEDEEIGNDESSISTALRAIGVERGAAHDEFAAIDLGRHRSTEDWHEHGS